METEMKMLKVIHQASKEHEVELVATYLGAHSIPKDKNLDTYTEEILNVHIPELIVHCNTIISCYALEIETARSNITRRYRCIPRKECVRI